MRRRWRRFLSSTGWSKGLILPQTCNHLRQYHPVRNVAGKKRVTFYHLILILYPVCCSFIESFIVRSSNYSSIRSSVHSSFVHRFVHRLFIDCSSIVHRLFIDSFIDSFIDCLSIRSSIIHRFVHRLFVFSFRIRVPRSQGSLALTLG